jgi:protein-disulfide isomerase
VPKSTFNLVIVAGVFFVVGVLVGLLSANALATPADVEQAVQKALASAPTPVLDTASIEAAVAKAVAEQFAALPRSSGESVSAPAMDEAALQRIVAEALLQASRNDRTRFELVDDDPYIGDPEAPIVIVEFSAYACPYCGRHFTQTLQPLLDNYGQYIRYVYRDYPTINPDVSVPSALAANCAHEQGQFWEFHDQLFRNQSRLGRDFFMSTASELGLNMEAFTACFEEQRYMNEINGDYFDGSAKDITGTPAFFINGQRISGAQPYAAFERVILRELEKVGIVP